MKKEFIKTVIIFILIFAIIVLTITYVLKFRENSNITKTINDTLVAQSNISEYIGKIKSETFEIYTIEQLLIGSSDKKNVDTTRIKDNDGKDLLQMVTTEDTISRKDTTFYRLNLDNIKKEFDISLYGEDGITWYIKSTGEIKVNYTTKPAWWNNGLDAVYIGK